MGTKTTTGEGEGGGHTTRSKLGRPDTTTAQDARRCVCVCVWRGADTTAHTVLLSEQQQKLVFLEGLLLIPTGSGRKGGTASHPHWELWGTPQFKVIIA